MKVNAKRIFYTICVMVFCLCDQQIGSSTGEMQLISPNLILIMLTAVILSHYPLKSYLRLPYGILTGVWILLIPAALWWGSSHTYYHLQWISFIAAAVLLSFCAVRTCEAILRDRIFPGTNHLFLILTAALILLMRLSRYDKQAPLLLILVCFLMYLTNMRKEEKRWLLLALQDGLIISFFLLQGLAFIFRPYDTLRYLGMYTNTNMNALFYQAVFCAFLSKFCLLESQQLEISKDKEAVSKVSRPMLVLKWGCFAFACAMWSFVILTMCRSAMVGMAGATLIAAIYCVRLHKRIFTNLFRYGACYVLIVLASFPIVYSAVRYLPAVFHHPVWLYDEYSEEKVHSWDPYDSPKYTDWRDVLQENFGRLFNPFTNSTTQPQDDSDFQGMTVDNESSANSGLPTDDNQASASLPTESNSGGSDSTDQDEGLSGKLDRQPDTSAGTGDGLPDQPDTGAGTGDSPSDQSDFLTGTGDGLSDQPDTGAGTGDEMSDMGENTSGQELPESEGTSANARKNIYLYYLKNLNWRGHLDTDNGIQVSQSYYAPHAHDIFLQFAFNYGLPTGLLLLVLAAITLVRLIRNTLIKGKTSYSITAMLFYSATVLYGVTELMWRPGQLSFTLLFLLPYFAWHTDIEEDAH